MLLKQNKNQYTLYIFRGVGKLPRPGRSCRARAPSRGYCPTSTQALIICRRLCVLHGPWFSQHRRGKYPLRSQLCLRIKMLAPWIL